MVATELSSRAKATIAIICFANVRHVLQHAKAWTRILLSSVVAEVLREFVVPTMRCIVASTWSAFAVDSDNRKTLRIVPMSGGSVLHVLYLS